MEGETKTVVGVCEEISEKGGWTQFSVNVGTQYPVRLSTKVEAIIKQARAAGSDPATWRFKESQGNENPNRPGSYYTNRYLEAVELGAPATAGGSPHAVPEDERQRLIVRQSCLKAAVKALRAVEGVTTEAAAVAATIRVASAFEAYVYRNTPAVASEPPADEPPADPDDIPF